MLVLNMVNFEELWVKHSDPTTEKMEWWQFENAIIDIEETLSKLHGSYFYILANEHLRTQLKQANKGNYRQSQKIKQLKKELLELKGESL
jgi:hypothetical protein